VSLGGLAAAETGELSSVAVRQRWAVQHHEFVARVNLGLDTVSCLE
jgi:hypothetical protein